MTKTTDPFEEFLRKKKVELLEQQYRDQQKSRPPAVKDDAPPDDAVVLATEDDPEADERLREEMKEFFQSGQTAGKELFEKASGISEDEVEEIKDALDDVFEEDTPQPQEEEDGGTFVNFFKQVTDSFPEGERPQAAPEPPPAPQSAPEPPPIVEDVAHEVSTRRAGRAGGRRRTERIHLAELLLGGGADTDQRVEVLCRVVARLVERSSLPESEIVEALIKAGVEF